MIPVRPLDAVVFISGSGSTLQNLYDCARQGACAINIKGVLSSKPGVLGLERARAVNLPVQVVNRKDYMDSRAFSQEVFRVVNALKPELIVLAGFTSLLTLPERYIGKTLNVHPALLPAFGGKGMYGIHVHEAVLKAGEKESGCTVHFVDNEYDHGPVILQKRVPVLAGDTPQKLMARVQLVEREAYPEAINMLADGRVRYEKSAAVFNKAK